MAENNGTSLTTDDAKIISNIDEESAIFQRRLKAYTEASTGVASKADKQRHLANLKSAARCVRTALRGINQMKVE